jgi:hypothetical protein
MKWHQKSPWNFNANKVYASYRPIINTLEDSRNIQTSTLKNKKMPEIQKDEQSIYKRYINKVGRANTIELPQ